MYGVGFGDLAVSYRNTLQNTQVKSDLVRLGQELSTGQTTDLKAATHGDLGGFSGIEAALSSLAAFTNTAKETAIFASVAQKSLELIQDLTAEIAPVLVGAATMASTASVQTTANDAKEKFGAVISALNTQVAGRSIFAGTGVGGAALADADTMLADLSIAVAGETTAGGVSAVVEDWFDAIGGGFETNGYIGETQDLEEFRVGTEFRANLQLRADDQGVRDILKGYAMAALVKNGVLNGLPDERATLLTDAGREMLSAQSNLTALRAEVGTVEATVDQAIAHNTAETQALEIAKGQIIGVDPYQSATELQAAETRLETLYAITARLSRLSLVDYLR